MIASSTPSLRPLGLGQLLDQAIRLYRNNFIKFIGIIAIVQVPVSLISIITTSIGAGNMLNSLVASESGGIGPEYWQNFALLMTVAVLLGLVSLALVWVVGAAAMTRSVTNSLLAKPTTIAESYLEVGSTWRPLLLTIVEFAALFVLALIASIVIPCIGWLLGPSLLTVLTWVIFPLLIPIVVLEGKRGLPAIRRAWDLARRRFWPVLGFVFILYLFSQLIVTGPTTLASVVMTAMMGSGTGIVTESLVRTIGQSVVSLLFGLLYMPLQLIAVTLLYFDLRVRTEGFDLAIQAQASTPEEAALAQAETALETAAAAPDFTTLVTQAPPADTTSPLITSKEAGYLAIMSLAVIGLCGLLYAFTFVVGMLMFSSMRGF